MRDAQHRRPGRELGQQAHRLGTKEPRIHQLEVGCDPHRETDPRQHMVLQRNAGRDFGEHDALGGEIEHRPFSDEQDLLRTFAGVLAVEGELLDAGHPFLHRPVGIEHEPTRPVGRILRPSVVSVPEKTTLRAPWLILMKPPGPFTELP